MNPVKKIYCRIFQKAFHIAQPLLPYHEPNLLRRVADIPPLLADQGIRAILLVTDSFLRTSGITTPLEQQLEEAGIRCLIYDRTRANPTVQNVEEARELYLEHNCQVLIAFGGGSAMDCAKAVGARIARPNKPLNKMKGILRVMRRIPPLFAIPTTAGTGSETTLAAVITDAETHTKYPINDFFLIPDWAVLDPEVTYTLPPHLTATTGMDALTHAVEAFIGRSTNPKTRQQALEATRLIFGNLETAYACGTDRTARANMLKAAFLAGSAFTVSYVGYIHAVAHSLGGQYNIPHGLANAVLLPNFLEAYGEPIHKKLHHLALAAGISTTEDTDREGAEKFIAAVRAMNKRMGIPETLPGICEADIPVMAAHAEAEANPLYPVPTLMTRTELEQFYYQVADWSENHARNQIDSGRTENVLSKRRNASGVVPN